LIYTAEEAVRTIRRWVMTEWRPDNWKNGWSSKREEDGMCSKAEIFEAGADAMLKALCTDENRLECVDSFHDVCGRVVSEKKLKGWLAFIPDEGAQDGHK